MLKCVGGLLGPRCARPRARQGAPLHGSHAIDQRAVAARHGRNEIDQLAVAPQHGRQVIEQRVVGAALGRPLGAPEARLRRVARSTGTTHASPLRLACVIIAATALLAAGGRAEDEHEHEHEHEDEHEHGDAPSARVATLERFGVTLATVGPGIVDPGLELPGEIRPDATRTAHVAARFAGVVRAVHARAGETVRTGDVLAVVESQSLAPYELRAPFDGVVVNALSTPGEIADPATAAFVVADLSTVWAEISVYQKHLGHVRPGQRVRIAAGYDVADAEGTVSYVSPTLDETTRTATARAALPNPDGRWRPGMFVTAYVLDPLEVAIAVPTSALQRSGDDTVVFVVDGNVFRPQPVTLGRVGLTTAEVTAGLAPGARIAAAGSFLVKAELGKGADAGHAH